MVGRCCDSEVDEMAVQQVQSSDVQAVWGERILMIRFHEMK